MCHRLLSDLQMIKRHLLLKDTLRQYCFYLMVDYNIYCKSNPIRIDIWLFIIFWQYLSFKADLLLQGYGLRLLSRVWNSPRKLLINKVQCRLVHRGCQLPALSQATVFCVVLFSVSCYKSVNFLRKFQIQRLFKTMYNIAYSISIECHDDLFAFSLTEVEGHLMGVIVLAR